MSYRWDIFCWRASGVVLTLWMLPAILGFPAMIALDIWRGGSWWNLTLLAVPIGAMWFWREIAWPMFTIGRQGKRSKQAAANGVRQ